MARLAVDASTPVATMGWCTLGSAFAAETVGRSGVDVVCIDLEHGLTGWDGALRAVMTLSAAAIPNVVRVSSHEPIGIMKALDAGADGVVVPHVQTPADAAAAVAACLYPPVGERSWGPTRASLLSERDTDETNRAVVCLAMLESVEAISNAAPTAKTVGLSGMLVGSNDLSLDMASTQRSRASARGSHEFRDMLASVAQECRGAGIVSAAPAGSRDEAELLKDLGIRVIVLPSDGALLRRAVEQEVSAVYGPDTRGRPSLSDPGWSSVY
jgi:4-hydroxy-2-oxoheptanedioate aldolase